MTVLDTHTWLWWAADRDKLPAALRRRLEGEKELVLSSISCWEVGMLVERGRLKLRDSPRLAIRELLAIPRLRVEAVSETIATEAGLLGDAFHGDPADRLIIATALEFRAPLATKDERIRRSKLLQTIW